MSSKVELCLNTPEYIKDLAKKIVSGECSLPTPLRGIAKGHNFRMALAYELMREIEKDLTNG